MLNGVIAEYRLMSTSTREREVAAISILNDGLPCREW